MHEQIALVVDDNSTNRLLASTILKKLGWSTHEADSGEKALIMMAEQAYQLVLLDISMPGMSGEEACVEIRQRFPRELCVIAYTAHAFPDEHEHFLSIGFDDVLVKPINKQKLEEMIRARVTGA